MNIVINNVPPETTEDEVKQLLVKYGFPEFTSFQMEPGDGTRPLAIIGFEGVHNEGIRPLIQRVDGLFWKDRRISVAMA
jgi:RNA recognition motif-containing protein